MKPRVYVETTIPSYLTARPSRNLLTAARQQLTHDWWRELRPDFDVVVSEAVIRECSGGDPAAAAARLAVLAGLAVLPVTDEAAALARHLLVAVPLPETAATDAVHIAVAAIAGSDYLLTWNCAHIANAVLRGRVEASCRDRGYRPPMLCTPHEFFPGRVDPDG